MRGMVSKTPRRSRASLSRGLAAMHVILLSTGGGTRGSPAPQRGRGTRRLACLSLRDPWNLSLSPIGMRVVEAFSAPYCQQQHTTAWNKQQQTVHVGQIGASILPTTTHAP